jgi:NAD(P)-dependent dehydrogenase (short-subunit alcohol dehydrogenase family)
MMSLLTLSSSSQSYLHASIPLAAASISLLYALSACFFLAGWREASLPGLLARPVCLRGYALWIVALAVTVARRRRYGNDDEEAEAEIPLLLLDLALWSLGFAVASWWLCRQVRTELVEGGPPPGPSVFLDENNIIMSSGSSSKVVVITGCNQGIGKETLRLLFAPSGSTLTEESSSSASSSSSTTPLPTTQANGGSSSSSSSKEPGNAARPRHTVILCCRSVDRARQAAVDVGLLLPERHGGNKKTVATRNGDQQPHRISNNGAAHARTGAALPHVSVELVELDLSDLEQVRVAAGRILASHPVVHVLVNNAGLMMDRRQFAVQQQQQPKHEDEADESKVSSAPYELVMTANHLGHFLLTRLLRPAECIVNVSSCTYALSDPNFVDDLFCTNGIRTYTMFGQYAASKAANLLFTAELSRRVVQEVGRRRQRSHNMSPSQQPNASEDKQEERCLLQYPACHAVHPGMVRTNVVRNMPWYLRIPNDLLGFLVSPFQKAPEQGAWNTVHAVNATYKNRHPSPNEQSLSSSSWTYWVNRRPSDVLPWIHDEETARRLWEMSSDLVDLPYDYYDDEK